MNWVDFLIIILLVLFGLEGLRRGFLGEFLDFLSFLLSFFLSFRFYNLAAVFFEGTFKIAHSLSNVLGFVGIWFLTEAVFFLILQLLTPKIKLPEKFLKLLDPVAMIPAMLRGLVFIALLLVIVGTFPIQPKLKLAVNESKIGSAVLSQAQALEHPLKSVFGGITQDTFSFLTIKPESSELVDLGFATSQFKVSPAKEGQMIRLVNKERVSRGFKPLNFNPQLQEVARAHSGDMFSRGYFSHFSPEGKNVADRAAEKGISYIVIGENLAYAPNLELAHNGLMNSPGHRANILSEDFGQIGIGLLDGGVYGIMVTQVFKD